MFHLCQSRSTSVPVPDYASLLEDVWGSGDKLRGFLTSALVGLIGQFYFLSPGERVAGIVYDSDGPQGRCVYGGE
jgi:hypothetical protein